jgi:type VI secretion system protein ImpG
MADELLTYYNRELAYFRQLGAEFAAKYPKIAGRLLLETDKSEDPHLERLIQAFAFLTARVHHKIDDELPEITDALLSVLYPHYLAPIPSMSIVQFVVDPDQGKLTTGHPIPRGTPLESKPVGGTPCRFRTCYPVTLWPIEVASARFDSVDQGGKPPRGAAGLLRLELRCQGVTLSELALRELRFFLQGEDQLVFPLYELLLNDAIEVQIRAPRGQGEGSPVSLGRDALGAVGFGPDEGMLPYGARSFLGYRLLHEYFAFPYKYLFVDVAGLEQATRAGCRDAFEMWIFLRRPPRLEQQIGPDTFRLGCTPIVNLFEQIAEPIRLTHAETEYRVIPDVRRPSATEVYSVDSVASTSPHGEEVVEFEAFYSFRHTHERDRRHAFWHATRRPSPRKGDSGSEVFLSLVDLDFKPTLPPVETLMVHATCTNRDLPGKLPFGGSGGRAPGDRGDFQLEAAAPLSQIRCLKKPTETVRPPLGRGAEWRLISHLALNHLSICEGGRDALQEILRLYDFADSAATRQQIAGITDVTSRRVVGRPSFTPWDSFCRGIEVSVELDEDKYVGSGVFLFAAVLERFLGLYTAINSFVQTVATTRQREEPLRRWPPRAGQQVIL